MKVQEHSETRRAILSGARRLLAAGGTETLTMRRLAQDVGLTATAIYHYFESKDDLVSAVVEEGFRSFGAQLEAAAASFPAGSLERIAAIGEAYVRFGLEHREHFQILFNLEPRTRREIHELPSDGGYQVLRRSVVDAMKAGSLCQRDPDVVSVLLWTVAHGLVTLELACSFDDLERDRDVPASRFALFRAFERLIWDGIGTERSPSAGRPLTSRTGR